MAIAIAYMHESWPDYDVLLWNDGNRLPAGAPAEAYYRGTPFFYSLSHQDFDCSFDGCLLLAVLGV